MDKNRTVRVLLDSVDITDIALSDRSLLGYIAQSIQDGVDCEKHQVFGVESKDRRYRRGKNRCPHCGYKVL